MTGRTKIAIFTALVASLFIGANAHLLYMALKWQPECVPHLKAKSLEADRFRAAKSSC